MTGWLIFIGFGVFILILRNDQKIEAWWRSCKARATGTTMNKHSQELYEQEWSRGKQVTFMEPPASVVSASNMGGAGGYVTISESDRAAMQRYWDRSLAVAQYKPKP